MKKVKVQDAIGMTLCHDITAMVDGFKGAAFKRGHVITQEDIPRLLISASSMFLSGKKTQARFTKRMLRAD